MDEHPRIRITDADGDVKIVEFQDRKILEEFTIAQIGEDLTGLITGMEKPQMLVDFKEVEHLSSAALGMLINLHNQIDGRGGSLKLSNICSQIYEVFKITKLNSFFDIHDSREDALSSF